MRCGGQWEATRRLYLGKTSEHTVFEGELVGLILGIHLASVYGRFPRISLFVDNQAAIKALQKPKARAGHHLVDTFYKQLEQMLRNRPRLAITIHWVPGHIDVEGNERADDEAKAAALGRSSQPSELPPVLRRPLATSASAVKQHTLTKLKTKAKILWKKSTLCAKDGPNRPSTPRTIVHQTCRKNAPPASQSTHATPNWPRRTQPAPSSN